MQKVMNRSRMPYPVPSTVVLYLWNSLK